MIDALYARKSLAVKQFVLSSTMLAHRDTEPGWPIDEDAPLEGEWAYPESKIQTEQLLHGRRDDIPVELLRLAGVYTDACDSIPLARQI
jgi:nucleoside-diphosphate-sugar epimerase